jgi:hypothetical protein
MRAYNSAGVYIAHISIVLVMSCAFWSVNGISAAGPTFMLGPFGRGLL